MTPRLHLGGRAAAAVAGLLLASACIPSAARAGTATTTMAVSMTITAGCTVVANPTLAFPGAATLGTPVTATGTISVTCTNSSPYNVGLDKGAGTGATITVRKMTGPASATINYGLYQNAGLTTNFGNTVGTDTEAGTGTGAAQTISVFGQVPAQTSPAPGSYADTVNVTVTF